MPDCSYLRPGGSLSWDVDLTDSMVMQAYLQLPLLPRDPDGCWVARVNRVGDREVRLVESVPTSAQHAVLRLELFDWSTQTVIESRDCAEVEDAIAAYRAICCDHRPGAERDSSPEQKATKGT